MAESTRIEDKLRTLKEHIAQYDKLAVAFSAGVDSTFLLYVAHEVLGNAVCALTAQSPAFPSREHAESVDFCSEHGIRQIVFGARHFEIEGFADNPPERCYLCKKALFGTMMSIASMQGLGQLADGSNTDDMLDYRPGNRAVQELGVVSPLVECGFSKRDIRDASALIGLRTAAKPSLACLATRAPYGQTITPELLGRIDASEQVLIDMGLNTVRVRANGDEARIEVLTEDMEAVLGQRERIVDALKETGFSYVSLDLQGYRTGSMNEALSKD